MPNIFLDQNFFDLDFFGHKFLDLTFFLTKTTSITPTTTTITMGFDTIEINLVTSKKARPLIKKILNKMVLMTANY